MRPFPTLRASIMILLDAVGVCLLVAGLLAGVEIVRNEYVQLGYVHHLLYAPAHRFRELLLPILVMFAVMALAVGTVTRLYRRSPKRAMVLATASGAVLLGLFVYRRELIHAALANLPDGAARMSGGWYRVFTGMSPGNWLLLVAVTLGIVTLRIRSAPSGSSWKSFALPLLTVILAAGLLGGAAVERRIHNGRHPGRKNVLLVVLDTTAANHMASYGYHRQTTPEIDGLTERGTLFLNSYAVSPWTLPSHASMFTGLFPIQHRATQERLDLDYSFSTLAEILREDGYRTLAAVNNPILGPSTKMQQGFETWYPMWHRVLQSGFERGERHATNRVVETLVDSLGADERFFLFLNYVEPHIPYEPPPEFRNRFRSDGPPEGLDPWWHRYYSGKSQLSAEDFQVLQDLYDGELAFLSHTIGDLINLLEERELLDDTLVILTSDHGENLGDHGHLDHVFNIYDTLLRVPLIILDPERPGARRDLSVTSSVDIFATILSAAGLPNTRSPSEARDLLQPSQTTESVPSIAEYYYPLQVFSVIRHELDEDGLRRMERYLRRLRSVRIDGWKLIWASDGSRELYHVLDDPDEEHNLAEQEPERVRELTALLEERLRDLAGHDFRLDQEEPPDGIDGFVGLDRDTLERLRSLGYVQ